MFASLSAATLDVVVTATPSSTDTGDTISYKIKMTNNTGAKIRLYSVECDLPSSFTYISGSTSGAVSVDPSISSNELTWIVDKNIQDTKSRTLRFKARASLTRGNYPVYVTCSGPNFDTTSVGPTASVECKGPILTLSKTATKTTAKPGDVIKYTISYSNAGNGKATYVFILEDIPTHTEYVEDTAAGSGMTITYSHNNGLSYDTLQTTTVTNLSFQRNNNLRAGGSGAVRFKVKVK